MRCECDLLESCDHWCDGQTVRCQRGYNISHHLVWARSKGAVIWRQSAGSLRPLIQDLVADNFFVSSFQFVVISKYCDVSHACGHLPSNVLQIDCLRLSWVVRNKLLNKLTISRSSIESSQSLTNLMFVVSKACCIKIDWLACSNLTKSSKKFPKQTSLQQLLARRY